MEMCGYVVQPDKEQGNIIMMEAIVIIIMYVAIGVPEILFNTKYLIQLKF